jgi:hypothetical protein
MRRLATIQTPAVIRAILDCLGLPARPPPIARAREEEDSLGVDAGPTDRP